MASPTLFLGLIPPPTSLSQLLFSLSLPLAALLTFMSVTPPHMLEDTQPTTTTTTSSKNPSKQIPKHDFIRTLSLTTKYTPLILFSHIGFLALYTAYLSLSYSPSQQSVIINKSNIHLSSPVCHNSEFLSTDLLTWTPYTIVPLVLIILLGTPLRLIPYTTLSTNFTFALAEPTHLITTGIYRYLQHPSYTGLICLFAGNALMYYRVDTPALACLVAPEWYPSARAFIMWFIWPTFVVNVLFAISMRVRQEEKMLKGKFGKEWVEWHTKTARFVPGLRSLGL